MMRSLVKLSPVNLFFLIVFALFISAVGCEKKNIKKKKLHLTPAIKKKKRI